MSSLTREPSSGECGRPTPEILEELGRGDEIAVAERLNWTEAITPTEVLDDLPGDDRL